MSCSVATRKGGGFFSSPIAGTPEGGRFIKYACHCVYAVRVRVYVSVSKSSRFYLAHVLHLSIHVTGSIGKF